MHGFLSQEQRKLHPHSKVVVKAAVTLDIHETRRLNAAGGGNEATHQ